MIYSLGFLLSLGISLSLTPLIIRESKRFSLYDNPDRRKFHKERRPTLGGIAIILSSFISLTLITEIFFKGTTDFPLLKVIIASLPVIGVSIYDDIKGSPIGMRFLFQIIGGGLFLLLMNPLQSLNLPFIGKVYLGGFSYPVGILWILLITNAINLIDGLDGLAAGVVAISSLFLFFSSLLARRPIAGLWALSLCGASMGFLPYNFSPARIFMGDTGSAFLGFSLGSLSLIGAGKSVALVSLLFPVLALGFPILDVVTTVVRRSRNRRNIFEADREHIHYKILKLGIDQKKAVLYLYLVTFLLGCLGLSLFSQNRIIPLLILLIGLVISIIIFKR